MKKIKIIIVLSIIGIFVAPILLTREWGCISFDEACAFVGDTIGGTTAPIIGLVSIILLYYTFREQRKFNKKQVEFNRKQIEFNDYTNLIKLRNNILELSNNIPVITRRQKRECKYTNRGVEHINTIINDDQTNVIDKADFKILYNDIFNVINLCFVFSKILSNSQLTSDKKEILTKTMGHYIKLFHSFYVNFENEKFNIADDNLDEGVDDELEDKSIFEEYKNDAIAMRKKLETKFPEIITQYKEQNNEE